MVAQECHGNVHSKLCKIKFGLTVQVEYGFEMQFSLLIYFIVHFFTTTAVLCAIWYHLHNLKNVKKTHEGVLL